MKNHIILRKQYTKEDNNLKLLKKIYLEKQIYITNSYSVITNTGWYTKCIQLPN